MHSNENKIIQDVVVVDDVDDQRVYFRKRFKAHIKKTVCDGVLQVKNK